jgi:hypothetical protein
VSCRQGSHAGASLIVVLHRALPDLQRMKLLLFCCRVVGTEVGILFLVRLSPTCSWTGFLEHIRLSPRAIIGPGARFLEFLFVGPHAYDAIQVPPLNDVTIAVIMRRLDQRDPESARPHGNPITRIGLDQPCGNCAVLAAVLQLRFSVFPHRHLLWARLRFRVVVPGAWCKSSHRPRRPSSY